MCELQRDSAEGTPSQNSWLQTDYSFPIEKPATKEVQGEPNSHSPCGVIPTEASFYCFSFYQEPIQNNSWKHKPPYYSLHCQVVGVFVFCLLWDWIILLFACQKSKINHFHYTINLTLGKKIPQMWIYRLLLRCNKQTIHFQNNNC